MKTILIISVTVIAALAGAALAQPETAKINTEEAYTVPAGHVEVLAGYGYLRATRTFSDDGSGVPRGENEAHFPELSITWGMRERLDVGLFFNYADLRDNESDAVTGSGFGDVSAGMKWVVVDRAGFAFAWMPGVTVPVGEEPTAEKLGPGEGFWSFDQLVAVTLSGSRLTFGADAAYRVPFGDDELDQQGLFAVNLALGYQWTSWLQPEVELNLGHDFIRRTEDSQLAGVTFGFIINAHDILRIDAGAYTGVIGRNADKATGAILNFALLI